MLSGPDPRKGDALLTYGPGPDRPLILVEGQDLPLEDWVDLIRSRHAVEAPESHVEARTEESR